MTSTKLIVKNLVPDTASRTSGEILRGIIVDNLKRDHQIELDFSDVILTPSFADEAFGLLCHNLSKKELSHRIKFTHLSPTHKALLLRVIGNRFAS